MNQIFRRTIILFSFFVLLAVGAAGQADKKKVESPLSVELRLLIMDAAGSKVVGIKKEEVKVFEDDGQQTLLSFVEDNRPLYLEMVVDNTGSMRQALDREIAAASFIVQNLGSAHAQITRFVGRDNIKVLSDWTDDKGKLKTQLDNLFVEGGLSAVWDGLLTGLDEIEKVKKTPGDKRFALVVISDLEDRDSQANWQTLLTRFNDAEVPVFIVSFASELSTSDPGFSLMGRTSRELSEMHSAELALRTGGAVYQFPQSVKTLDALGPLVYELRAPYVCSYEPQNQKRNGKERKLRVEVSDAPDGSKRSVKAKASYTVPKDK